MRTDTPLVRCLSVLLCFCMVFLAPGCPPPVVGGPESEGEGVEGELTPGEGEMEGEGEGEGGIGIDGLWEFPPFVDPDLIAVTNIGSGTALVSGERFSVNFGTVLYFTITNTTASATIDGIPALDGSFGPLEIDAVTDDILRFGMGEETFDVTVPPVSNVVDSEGGHVVSTGGAIVFFPDGAVSNGTSVILADESQGDVESLLNLDFETDGFRNNETMFVGGVEIDAGGEPFAKPVDVFIPLPGGMELDGMTIVACRELPDLDGDGKREIAIINTCSVTEDGRFVRTDPVDPDGPLPGVTNSQGFFMLAFQGIVLFTAVVLIGIGSQAAVRHLVAAGHINNACGKAILSLLNDSLSLTTAIASLGTLSPFVSVALGFGEVSAEINALPENPTREQLISVGNKAISAAGGIGPLLPSAIGVVGPLINFPNDIRNIEQACPKQPIDQLESGRNLLDTFGNLPVVGVVFGPIFDPAINLVNNVTNELQEADISPIIPSADTSGNYASDLKSKLEAAGPAINTIISGLNPDAPDLSAVRSALNVLERVPANSLDPLGEFLDEATPVFEENVAVFQQAQPQIQQVTDGVGKVAETAEFVSGIFAGLPGAGGFFVLPGLPPGANPGDFPPIEVTDPRTGEPIDFPLPEPGEGCCGEDSMPIEVFTFEPPPPELPFPTAVVGNEFDHSLTFIEASNGEILGDLDSENLNPPLEHPRAIAFTPDGRTLVVTNNALDTGQPFLTTVELLTVSVRAKLDLPTIGGVGSIAITPDGKTAVCTASVSGGQPEDEELIVVDIQDKSQPTVADEVIMPDTPTSVDVFALPGNQYYAVVATGFRDNGSGGDLVAVDITDPENSSIVGSVQVGSSGGTVRMIPGTARAVVAGNYLVNTSAQEGSIDVVDLSDPQSPIVVDSLGLSGVFFLALGVMPGGETAYISDAGDVRAPVGTVLIVDISNPENISVTNLDTPTIFSNGSASAQIAVSPDGSVLIASHHLDNRVSLFSVANPTAPSEISYLTTGDFPFPVTFQPEISGD